jgi:tetraacyldisaccharide 4'-kinase
VAAQGEYAMSYHGTRIINLLTNESKDLSEIQGGNITAIAGIGNPDRFFNYLRSRGLRLNTMAFPDHYHFEKDFMQTDDDVTVLMTEKDAVKCRRYAKPNWWYLPVDVELPKEFGLEIINLIGKRNG